MSFGVLRAYAHAIQSGFPDSIFASVLQNDAILFVIGRQSVGVVLASKLDGLDLVWFQWGKGRSGLEE